MRSARPKNVPQEAPPMLDAVDLLAAELRTLRADNETLRALLRETGLDDIQHGYFQCRLCARIERGNRCVGRDCRLAAALKTTAIQEGQDAAK